MWIRRSHYGTYQPIIDCFDKYFYELIKNPLYGESYQTIKQELMDLRSRFIELFQKNLLKNIITSELQLQDWNSQLYQKNYELYCCIYEMFKKEIHK